MTIESELNITPTREKEVVGLIQKIEVPFMEALQEEYGKTKGWRVCGPASISLSRIISHHTGIPIGRNIDGEHIELVVGIFDPRNASDRLNRIEEQTYIRYYTGNGNVYYIDAIYGLLMRGREEFHEAIQVEKYKVSEIDQALIEKHHLYAFDPNHDGITSINGLKNLTASERFEYINDSLAALNDDRATMSDFLADSKRAMRTNWAQTVTIIKKFTPDWKENIHSQAERLSELANTMFKKLELPELTTGLIRENNRREIIYKDQQPKLEKWGMKLDETVLTFHVNGERYIVKEGKLDIYKNGFRLEITQDHMNKIEAAIKQSESQDVKDFFKNNIKE